MEDITVEKKGLLEILKKNRDAHAAQSAIAKTAYEQAYIRKLRAHLASVKKDGLDFTNISASDLIPTPIPREFTGSYDRAIGMLKMSLDSTVKLSQADYARYVQDEWEWKQQWDTASNNVNPMKYR